ncbi:hypothetical protein [Streptomyces sp. ALI-76-A]|uniref:hypothetical protein n=1 Tax=Streptomyces sp. ALI-76-A TaxID=3025736 RepID=UPI00256EAA64|nr:hypothetical protein [Streptomyces sp. ALI-76-A]MDL5201100.1 hypothetical protein [Streptomyces sp. ALI-76-A]
MYASASRTSVPGTVTRSGQVQRPHEQLGGVRLRARGRTGAPPTPSKTGPTAVTGAGSSRHGPEQRAVVGDTGPGAEGPVTGSGRGPRVARATGQAERVWLDEALGQSGQPS